MPTVTTSIGHSAEPNAIRQEQEITNLIIGKNDIQLSSVSDSMIIQENLQHL